MNTTTNQPPACQFKPAPLELPFRALAQIAPSVAALMRECHVTIFRLPDGRLLELSAPKQEKK